MDRELATLLGAITLMERGEHWSASRALRSAKRTLIETRPELASVALRPAFGIIAATIDGRSVPPRTAELLQTMQKRRSIMRWPARVAEAAIASRAGRDVGALLRDFPALPEASFLSAVVERIRRPPGKA